MTSEESLKHRAKQKLWIKDTGLLRYTLTTTRKLNILAKLGSRVRFQVGKLNMYFLHVKSSKPTHFLTLLSA